MPGIVGVYIEKKRCKIAIFSDFPDQGKSIDKLFPGQFFSIVCKELVNLALSRLHIKITTPEKSLILGNNWQKDLKSIS